MLFRRTCWEVKLGRAIDFILLTSIESVILLGLSANRFCHYVDYNVCRSLGMPIINIHFVSVAINIYRIGMQVSYKREWNS